MALIVLHRRWLRSKVVTETPLTPNHLFFKHEGANRPTESGPGKLLIWSYAIAADWKGPRSWYTHTWYPNPETQSGIRWSGVKIFCVGFGGCKSRFLARLVNLLCLSFWLLNLPMGDSSKSHQNFVGNKSHGNNCPSSRKGVRGEEQIRGTESFIPC